MKKNSRYWIMLCISALIGGCGGVPEVIVDTALESAKDVVEESIDGLIEDFAEEILDPEQLPEMLLEGDEQ